jgi:Holliday junction DNA helicase RuvA
MISRITGVLFEKSPPRVGLDVGGIGYELEVSMSTLYGLPELGSKVTLLTYQVIREDAHLLFGFATEQERRAFRELIKITGVGARMALAVLSGMSVSDLAQAIAMQEAGRLTRIPGIGKKTAERLMLELKDKFGSHLLVEDAVGATRSSHADIIEALTALGYSEKESLTAVKGLAETVDVSEGIRLALKALSR